MNDVQLIPPLEPGGRSTLLSASRANQLIFAVNALLNSSGGNGIILSKAKAGFKIEIDPNWLEDFLNPVDDGSTEVTGSGNGNMRFRGTWSSGTTDYAENDVVEWTSNNQQGLFVAASGITGNGGDPFTGGTGDWTQIARDFSDRVYVRNSASNYIDIDAGNQQIILTDGSTTVTMDVGAADPVVKVEFSGGGQVRMLKSEVNGKVLYAQEVGICDSGTAKKTVVLCCDAYT